MTEPSASERELIASFRLGMRKLVSTVTIVTATDARRNHGMTMTAVSSVSMDPPSMLICVNQSTLLYDILQCGRRFCVNVLRPDQIEISNAFSGAVAPELRLRVGEWSRNDDSVDYLINAHVNIFCKKTATLPFGTHAIFIGSVEEVLVNEARDVVEERPLIYHNAGYCS